MTDPDYRHYILIIDRTGSMASIKQEAEAGIRHYLTEQAKIPGRATLSLWQFDSAGSANIDCVHDFADLHNVPPYTLVPRGMTPLWDAEGTVITAEGAKLAALGEDARPSKVVCLIATDGLNNDSREWDAARVAALITQQRETYGWEFTYIGANQDAQKTAAESGIAVAAGLTYNATPGSTQTAWRSAAKASARYAGGQSAGIYYTNEEREETGKA